MSSQSDAPPSVKGPPISKRGAKVLDHPRNLTGPDYDLRPLVHAFRELVRISLADPRAHPGTFAAVVALRLAQGALNELKARPVKALTACEQDEHAYAASLARGSSTVVSMIADALGGTIMSPYFGGDKLIDRHLFCIGSA